jgi:uncharacterized RDD family membrane protein YckC
MSFDAQPIRKGTRLGAMALDHIFMTIIMTIFMVPEIVVMFSNAFRVSHDPIDFHFMEGPYKYLAFAGICLYFCKDIFNGRSLAKRILKLQVVDQKTGLPANPMQCFIRNLFCIIWPVEAIVALADTSRRIGDRVAGTRLVFYQPSQQKQKLNAVKLLIPLILSYAMIGIIFQLVPDIKPEKIIYSKASYNEVESKELQKMLSDSLGEYLTPDVRIYDTVNHGYFKYISAILILKKNYLANENDEDQLYEMTTRLIYSMHPKDLCTGQVKYYFKSGGNYQALFRDIGTYIKALN